MSSDSKSYILGRGPVREDSGCDRGGGSGKQVCSQPSSFFDRPS